MRVPSRLFLLPYMFFIEHPLLKYTTEYIKLKAVEFNSVSITKQQ